MARPKTKIARRTLKDYVEIALDEMPPPSYVREVIQGTKRYPDWRNDALTGLHKQRIHETFATEEEYVKEILAGKAEFTWNFVKALHTILDLKAWDLEFAALWQNDDATDLRYSPDEFRQRLQKTREDQPEPFREFPAFASPVVQPWIAVSGPLPAGFSTGTPIPKAVMQFGETLPIAPDAPASPKAPVLTFTAGARYALTFTARLRGRVLLIGRDRENQTEYLLNSALGLQGFGDLTAGEVYTGQIWTATDKVGDWDLAVLFLGSELVKAHPELSALIERSAGLPDPGVGDDHSAIHPAEMGHLCRLLREMPKMAGQDMVQLGLHSVQIRKE